VIGQRKCPQEYPLKSTQNDHFWWMLSARIWRRHACLKLQRNDHFCAFWFTLGSALALSSALVLGGALTLGKALAVGGTLALGRTLALDSAWALGRTLALGGTLALGRALALDSALTLGKALALGRTLALGSVLAFDTAFPPATGNPPRLFIILIFPKDISDFNIQQFCCLPGLPYRVTLL